MSFAIKEMHRVIRPGRAVIIVVGPSTMRGLPIETHDHLAAIAQEIGFEVAGVVRRPINRDKRMMPARWHNNGQSVIEQRMHEEFAIGLVKP
jgi:DNA modification methylase